MGPLLAIAANSSWNLLNFRRGLLQGLMQRGYRIAAIVPPGDGISQLQQIGVSVYQVPVSPRGLSPFSDLRLLLAYKKRLDDLAPAAFLGFTSKPNIYGSMAAHRAGIPVVANITGLGTGFLSGKTLEFIQSRLYRLALVNVRKVFFHNNDDRELFISRGLARSERSEVIPGSGINLNHFEVQPPSGNKQPVFLFIGRFLKDKGIVEFVEAAKCVKKRWPSIRFQALGSAEPHPKSVPMESVRKWQDDGVVEFFGSAEDVRPFIAGADCVVLPSYREGLPRVLLEASAMGRAVIGSDVPGCRQVVENGITGFLCQARSASSLADAMMKFASLSADRWHSMGIKARRKAEEEFSERRVIDAYLATLDSFGANSRGATGARE